MAGTGTAEKPKLTFTQAVSKGKGFVSTAKNELKSYWHVPRPGFEMPYKEWASATLSTACDSTHSSVFNFLSFSASCYLIMRYYQVDALDFTVIGLIGAPLGYFWSILGWSITDNLGHLEKKRERRLVGVYTTAVIAGIALMLFCPVSFGEAFVKGFGKIFGVQIFLNGFNSVRDLYLRKYLIPKYGRYKFWPYVNAPMRVITTFILLYWDFSRYNYGDMLWRLYLCFSLNSMRPTGGFANSMYPFATNNNDERVLLQCYPIKIGGLMKNIIGDWTVPILATMFGGPENIRTMRWLNLPIGLITLGTVLATIPKIKERLPQPPVEKKVTFTFWEGVTGVLRNKYRWITMVSGVFDYFGEGARLARDCIWFYMLRMSDGGLFVFLRTVSTLYNIPAEFLAPFIIKRFDFKKLYMVSRSIAVVCDVLELLAVLFLNNHSVVTLAIALLVLNFISGLFTRANAKAIENMNIKINDYQMWLSGERLESYSGVFGWVQAPATYIIGLLIPLLYRTYGLSSDYDVLFNHGVRLKVWIFGALLCIAGDIICIIPYAFFNYSNKKHAHIMAEQKERAEAAWNEAEMEGDLKHDGTIGRPSAFEIKTDEKEKEEAARRKAEKEAAIELKKAQKQKRFKLFSDEKDYAPLPVYNVESVNGWRKKLYRKEDIEGAAIDAEIFKADGNAHKQYIRPRKMVLKNSVKTAVSIMLVITIVASLMISFKTVTNAKAEKYKYVESNSDDMPTGWYLSQFSGLSSETTVELNYAKKEIKKPVWIEVLEYFAIKEKESDVYETNEKGEKQPIIALGDFSLSNNTYLTSILIGPSVQYIGEWVFNNCPNLKEIKADPENKWFTSVDGVLYTKDMTELIAYPEARGYMDKKDERADNDGWVTYSEYEVPEGVKKIWYYAFYKVDTLTKISFPSTLEVIGEMAFWTCRGLTEIELNEGLKEIHKDAFSYCTEVKGEVILPSTLVYMGNYVFSKTAGITGFTANMTKEEFEERGVTKDAYRWHYRTGISSENEIKFAS